MSDATVRGDESTVVNIYYDRYEYELKFVFASRTTNSTTDNYYVPYLRNTFNPPGTMTWQAYCTQGSGLNWGNSNTNQFANIYAGDDLSVIDSEDYNGNTYYFYVIRAIYGADISSQWPSYDLFPKAGNYTLASWWMMAGADNYGSAGHNDTIKG